MRLRANSSLNFFVLICGLWPAALTASVELMESGFNKHAELQIKDANGKCQGVIPAKNQIRQGVFGLHGLPPNYSLL
jgi:hypothetical protein